MRLAVMRPRGRQRLLAFAACPLVLLAPSPAEAAQVERHGRVRVVRLSGAPNALGRQHGAALRDEVRGCLRRVLGYFRRALKVPLVRAWVVNWWLDTTWRRALSFVAPDHLAELRGLAEGAGVPLRELARFQAIPERTYACANLAAWGGTTAGGRLIHLRNLDWAIEAGAQDYATVFVVRPTGKRAFVSVGWAGFIGVLTGVNDARISIGQIGAKTVETTGRGEPMALLMRRVLEEATTVDQAADTIEQAHRTVGVNYVIADAATRRALALETTARRVRRFEANDPAEHEVPYARPMADAVFRADPAVDPAIRERQTASNGDPRRDGLESPAGSSAYDRRYLGLARGLHAARGAFDVERAIALAGAVAPDSNVQSVIFAWPDLWVANAISRTPAAQTRYDRLDLKRLLDPPRNNR